jgi:ubiquinone/menaquinone biosynthesis C-methylase UbiE
MGTTKYAFIPALKWHWATQFYDRFIAFTMPEKEIKNRTFDLCEIESKEKVLDFGCGTGRGLLWAWERNQHVEYVGFDVDPSILQIAKKRLPKEIKLSLGNSCLIPFPDDHFDKIWSTWVFHHLENRDKIAALKEIHRVLKPQGIFVLGDWGKPQNLLMGLLFFILQIVDNFSTTNANKKGAIPNLIRESGFRSIEERGYRNTIFGTFRYWVVRN